MADMSMVIVPKSDQINAEDFLPGPRTYVIEGVSIKPGTEQPVSIKLAGEKRVWRPCKSMSRVLVAAWGPDASKYTGRSVRLYLDPDVTWAGMKVGGIRVSHLSHIDRDLAIALTATRGKRVMATIKPLRVQEQPPQQHADAEPDFDAADVERIARDVATMGTDKLQAHWSSLRNEERKILVPIKGELKGIADEADRAAAEAGEPDDGMPF